MLGIEKGVKGTYDRNVRDTFVFEQILFLNDNRDAGMKTEDKWNISSTEVAMY